MLCERCNKNIATVHVLKIINGNKRQVMLCEKCANIISDVPLAATFDELDNFSFHKILSGLVNYINDEKYEKLEITCSNCNTSYTEFKSKGIVGCSECYITFYENIASLIKTSIDESDYNGKIPKKYGAYILEKRKINNLKEELERAILIEEYERAAELRDEIKKIHDYINGERDKNE